MGLDMFLYGRVNIHSHIHDQTPSRPNPKYAEIQKLCNLPDDDNWGLITINNPVMYWRKANQIHKWFVDKCQNGIDECQHTELSSIKLAELVDDIEEALANKDSTVLPPQSGFFFGSTEIDKWYWEDLEKTYKTLKEVLDANRYEYFMYHSSW